MIFVSVLLLHSRQTGDGYVHPPCMKVTGCGGGSDCGVRVFFGAEQLSAGSPATVRRRSIVSNLVVLGKRIARL